MRGVQRGAAPPGRGCRGAGAPLQTCTNPKRPASSAHGPAALHLIPLTMAHLPADARQLFGTPCGAMTYAYS